MNHDELPVYNYLFLAETEMWIFGTRLMRPPGNMDQPCPTPLRSLCTGFSWFYRNPGKCGFGARR